MYYSPSYYGYYYDPTYILVVIGAIITLWASMRVKLTFRRFQSERSMSGMTGAQVAEAILQRNGITDVTIEHVGGSLTDHFDPMRKVVRLSDDVYNSTSVAAIGVAAHECGHVLQHHERYLPMEMRKLLVPVANFGSKLGLPIFILGMILGSNVTLMQIGVWVFSLSILFQIITLPVEFDASKRALRMIEDYGFVTEQERHKSAKVLRAAALTYVAAAAASILQLLRFVLYLNNAKRDD